jgi:SAM-dependent methyltransferase
MNQEPTPAADRCAAAANQDKIWAHFQNVATESFDAARPRLEFLVAALDRRLRQPQPRVLNIGVGSGHFETTALARGWSVSTLDPDAEAIARLAVFGVAGHVGYIEQLPFADAAFDGVVASEVLEHLTAEQRATGLAEVARVLKPGGWFLGTVPYQEDLRTGQVVCPCCGALFHRWGHQQSFRLQTIREELPTCFEVAELRCTAFVPWRDRGLRGKLKSLVRLALARAGEMIAVPSIYWAARKR